ncbi:MAG: (Fe-S)-binding protein [Candidatus Velamenicoccus archaeovorus]
MVARVLVLLAIAAVAAGLFARRVRFLLGLLRLGRPVERSLDLPVRVEREVTVVLGQRKLLQRLVPGLMHAFIFWGFLVLLTTIAEAAGQAVSSTFALPLIGRTGWLGLVQDVFGALVLVGIGIALWIRKVQRPERFVGSHMQEADLILVWILGVILTLFGLNAVRIARALAEAPTAWTPISTALSRPFDPMSPSVLRVYEQVFLWSHLVLILAFLVYIPWSKHLHILVSFVNVFLSNTRPRGSLAPLRIDLEGAEGEGLVLGAATVTDLTWKQMLDLYTCTECGRCQEVCPAWNTGKPLSPKLLVMNLRDHLFEEGPKLLRARAGGAAEGTVALNPDVVDDEVLWSCTTCGACMQECPVDIEHIDHIVDMRRNLVMAESRFPHEAGVLLRNLEGPANPWGQPQAERGSWADGLDVPVLEPGRPAPEYLYWVGCAGSFDDRAKQISRAVAELLRRAGVPFAILGPRELCTGDPARRMGNEYLFQTLAERNVATLSEAGVTKIVANCPHCFNTLRNEYPDYGGRFEVVHHTELLGDLVAQGRLRPTAMVRALLTYHDPCYLGRHNEVYAAPRRLIEQVPGVSTIEMPRHGHRGLCCGAGGARMWMEEPIGKRINEERMDEAVSTGADTVGVACPYCLVMLDDAARGRERGTQVLDVAQILARSVGPAGS